MARSNPPIEVAHEGLSSALKRLAMHVVGDLMSNSGHMNIKSRWQQNLITCRWRVFPLKCWNVSNRLQGKVSPFR